MFSKLRPRRPSHATVVAYLALFVALGGSAWALAANSVGTAQLKDGAVTNPKLAKSSVGTGKVIDGSLLAHDFAAGQLAADHYVTFDLPAGSGFVSDDKTVLEKGPLKLHAECVRQASGQLGASVDITSTEQYTVTAASQDQGPKGFGRTGFTRNPGVEGVNTTIVAVTGLQSSFFWYGGVPISIINKSTSIDGVLSYGVHGYHDCEVSFFGG
jgi:hypothetical protein